MARAINQKPRAGRDLLVSWGSLQWDKAPGFAGFVIGCLLSLRGTAWGAGTDRSIGAVDPAMTDQASVAYRTNFAVYLTNRPWVEEMEIDLSMNHYEAAGGFTTWTAGLQPGGFVFHCISNSPHNSVLTFGESHDSYWQKSLTGISVASKLKSRGASEENSRQVVCLRFKQQLKDVLNFGIEQLDVSNVVWKSETQFTAGALTWIGQPASAKIQATIESFDRGLPSRIRYTNTEETNKVRLIVCQYTNASLPPSQVVITTLRNGQEVKSVTNIIRRLVFGLREDGAAGFLPSDFIGEKVVLKTFIAESNGSRYYVHPDGSRTPVDKPPGGFLGRRIFFLFIALVLIGATVAVFATMARNRRPGQNE